MLKNRRGSFMAMGMAKLGLASLALCASAVLLFLIVATKLVVNDTQAVQVQSSTLTADAKCDPEVGDNALRDDMFYTTPCGCLRQLPWATRPGAIQEGMDNTTCSFSAMQRGFGQRVVSFSFFGGRQDIRGYFQGIEGNAMTMPEFYPGWTMRVYHNISEEDKEAHEILCRLECRFPYLDFCQTKEIPLYGNMANWTAAAWRFLPIGDPQVDIFVSRDLDSRFLQREVMAVQEWIQSEKTWHIMRDHPSMVILKILAGMWGANLRWKRDFLRDLIEDIIKMPTQHYYGRDQDILAERVWPLVHGDSVRHESYDCLQVPTPDVRPWPTRREDKPYNYVGVRQRVDPVPLRDPCPPQCRPKDHQDWLAC